MKLMRIFEKIKHFFDQIKRLVFKDMNVLFKDVISESAKQNHPLVSVRRVSAKEAAEVSKRNQTRSIYSSVLFPKEFQSDRNDSEGLFDVDLDKPLHIWDYDYIDYFLKNNNLKHGGIPLCVKPCDKNLINKSDAVYCHQEKCWFWPFKEHANLDEIFPFFPKAFQFENEDILTPNLVPASLWGANLRKYLAKDEWDVLRRHTYAQSSYRCSICGGKGDQWPVECDEVWDYRNLEDGRGAAILVELRALCPRCHRVAHLGKSNVDGFYNESLKHLAYINGWSLKQAEQKAEEAFEIFEVRSRKNWLLGYDDGCGWDPTVEQILKRFFSEKQVPETR